MRAAYGKTALVVDEGSLASTREVRELLKITDVLRLPRVVLVGDAKQLDAVDAGKPFAQLQGAGMKTAVMKEIMRQRDPKRVTLGRHGEMSGDRDASSGRRLDAGSAWTLCPHPGTIYFAPR